MLRSPSPSGFADNDDKIIELLPDGHLPMHEEGDSINAIPRPEAAATALPQRPKLVEKTFTEQTRDRSVMVERLFNNDPATVRSIALPVAPEPNHQFNSAEEVVQCIYNQIFSQTQALDAQCGVVSGFVEVGEPDDVASRKIWLREFDYSRLASSYGDTETLQNATYARIFNAYSIAAINLMRMYSFSSEKQTTIANQVYQINADVFEEIQAAITQKNLKKTNVQDILARGKHRLVTCLKDAMKVRIEHDNTRRCEYNRDNESTQIFIKEITGLIKRKRFIDVRDSNIGTGYIDYQLHKGLMHALNLAKDWVMMENASHAVATDIKADNGKRAIILDEPQTQLTNEQLNEFIHIKEVEEANAQKIQLIIGNNRFDVLHDLPVPAWYSALKPLQKRLINHYLPRFINHQVTAPSQPREDIPVNKNDYMQSIHVQKSSAGEIKEVIRYAHSGTPVYLNHNDKSNYLEVTKNNLKQQKENANADVLLNIFLSSANSDFFLRLQSRLTGKPYKPDDSEIIKRGNAVADELNAKEIFLSKLCVNGFRRIERDQYEGICKFLAAIEANNQILDEMVRANNAALNADEKQSLSVLREIIRKINEKMDRYTPENIHTLLSGDEDLKATHILYLVMQASNLNNQLVCFRKERNEALKTTAATVNCASGENRTGIVVYSIASDAIKEAFANTNDNEGSQCDWPAIIALSGHHAYMTGSQGNTVGTNGFRAQSADALPARYKQQRKILVTEYSSYKSISDNELAPVIEKTYLLENTSMLSTDNKNKLLYLMKALRKRANDAAASGDRADLIKVAKILQETEDLCEKYQAIFIEDFNNNAASEVVNSDSEKYYVSDDDMRDSSVSQLINDQNESTAVANIVILSPEQCEQLKKRKINRFIADTQRYEKKLLELSVGEKIFVGACVFAAGLVGAVVGAAVGLMVGAAIGGVGGSIVPLFGNIFGAGIGGIAGAALGGIKLSILAGTVIGATLLSCLWGNTLHQNRMFKHNRPEIQAFSRGLREEAKLALSGKKNDNKPSLPASAASFSHQNKPPDLPPEPFVAGPAAFRSPAISVSA
ncbi:MAG TPA: hypothetical protein VHZ76_10770 [Gammaproteobacteria bacterium]|jgi:hypothetical protein|nr:hypothetical protein [Gammaproteobacteria bacterium]